MFAVETQQPHRIVLYESLARAQTGLMQAAREWASKEVGEKNVHEVDARRTLADYPDGILLHHEETPGERTVVVTRKQTQAGWFYAQGAVELSAVNRFTLLPAELAERPTITQVLPSVMQSRGGAMSYDEVLDELRATLERRRRSLV
jgi:hypothetical protein